MGIGKMNWLAGARLSRTGVTRHAGHAQAMSRLAHPTPHLRIKTKSHQISMLLLEATPQGLFFRVSSLIADNHHKCLSMSMLHKNTAFSIKLQSGPIKPNCAIF